MSNYLTARDNIMDDNILSKLLFNIVMRLVHWIRLFNFAKFSHLKKIYVHISRLQYNVEALTLFVICIALLHFL